MGDGRIDLPAAGQGVAEVVVGPGEVGLDFQGLLNMGDGLVEPAHGPARAMPRLLWAMEFREVQAKVVGPQRLAVTPIRRLPPRTSHQHRHDQRRCGAAHPATIGPRRGDLRRSPGQGQIQPDLRQVGVAVGHSVPSNLHQTDHRHEHPQIPKPADQQLRTLPPPGHGLLPKMPTSNASAPTTFQIGRLLPGWG